MNMRQAGSGDPARTRTSGPLSYGNWIKVVATYLYSDRDLHSDANSEFIALDS
jgi:hypothetical protein